MLVGEPYWTEEPPPEAYPALGIGRDECASLVGTLDRFEAAGMRVLLDAGRRPHLAYGRRHLGWGAFVLLAAQPGAGPAPKWVRHAFLGHPCLRTGLSDYHSSPPSGRSLERLKGGLTEAVGLPENVLPFPP
jgi:hypothetical protein